MRVQPQKAFGAIALAFTLGTSAPVLPVAAIASVATVAMVTEAVACEKPAGSTECDPAPDIKYHGTGSAKPNLNPEVCVLEWAREMMTGPGIDFWFTYYLRYPNGSAEDMEPVIRNRCNQKQWVTPGTKIGFWVDCEGYRWWFETAPITTNGRYTLELVAKERL